MTITLELSPEEVTALSDRAQAQGVDIKAALHGLVTQIVPAPLPERPALTDQQKGLAALMDFWHQGDATDDPEELAERDREASEMQANIRRWRAETGRSLVS